MSLLLLCQIGGAVAFATTPTWRSSSSSSLPLAHRASPIALTASSPWLVLPRGLLNFDGTAAKKEDDVTIRMAEKGDALGLAQLCTDCFFGPQDSADGPFVFLQRSIIWSRILQQVVRRLSIADEGRECRLLVATDSASGSVRACADVATHLFDRDFQRFELQIDEFPVGKEARRRYAWRPYIASMAVAQADRRRGLGAKLMREAEKTARGWGYRELMLEVATQNQNALGFYGRLGYKCSGKPRPGATSVEVKELLEGLVKYWQVNDEPKILMRKPLRPLML